eukprot:1158594-Pelagomonas_calceolata.AAC.1
MLRHAFSTSPGSNSFSACSNESWQSDWAPNCLLSSDASFNRLAITDTIARVSQTNLRVNPHLDTLPHPQLTYSQFMPGLSAQNIQLNRKVLSELAMTEPFSFKALVDQVLFSESCCQH